MSFVWLVAILLGLLSGCGQSSGIPTVPVKGRVEFTDGGDLKPLYDRQAAVQFASVDQPGVSAFGEIEEDGSFTLATLKDSVGSSGAVVGTHKVRLFVDDASEQYVAKEFTRFETSGITVTLPTTNEVVIKVRR